MRQPPGHLSRIKAISVAALCFVVVPTAWASDSQCEWTFATPSWANVSPEELGVDQALEGLGDSRFVNQARLRPLEPTGLKTGQHVLLPGDFTGRGGLSRVEILKNQGPRKGVLGFFLNLILGRRTPKITFQSKTSRHTVETASLAGKVFQNETVISGNIVRDGDSVTIGTAGQAQAHFEVLATGKTLTLSGRALPYLGKFIGLQDGMAVVRVVTPEFKSLDVLVEASDMALAGGRSRESAEAKLRLANSIALEFRRGETVRFRGADFQMHEGKIKTLAGDSVTIFSDGGEQNIPIQKVFKKINSNAPMTVNFRNGQYSRLEFSFGQADDLLEPFLNGAAKLTSLPDFQELDFRGQLEAITQYSRQFVEYESAARSAEKAGHKSYTDILACGSGVCRHLANLTGMILKEAGYASQRVAYTEPGQNIGHGWLEAVETIPGKRRFFFFRGRPTERRWVVDPSSGSEGWVGTLEEAAGIADRNPESLAARFYTVPHADLTVLTEK